MAVDHGLVAVPLDVEHAGSDRDWLSHDDLLGHSPHPVVLALGRRIEQEIRCFLE